MEQLRGGVELVSKINQVEKDIIRKHPGFAEQWFENNKRFACTFKIGDDIPLTEFVRVPVLIGGNIGDLNFLSIFNADIGYLTSDLTIISNTDKESKIIDPSFGHSDEVYRVLMNMDGGDRRALRICFDGYPNYGYHIFVLVLKESIELVNKYVTNL